MADESTPSFRERIRHHYRRSSLLAHLLGFLLRARLQKAGLVVVPGGWTLPTIQNWGGRIEVDNCSIFSGVRLEVWEGATITIGKGTYLNRNTEVVAARSVTIGRECKIARDVL